MCRARRLSTTALAVLLAAATSAPGAAQRRLTAVEFGAGGLASLAAAAFVGAALGVGYRTGGQTRLAALVAPGAADGDAALRGEATGQFMVTPAARRGPGLYVGAGIAYQAVEDRVGTPYLALLLGLEGAPGRRFGWYVETGVAGGVRVAAGVRRRWFPAWW